MPKEITAQVSNIPAALEKSQRYFSASLHDILVELLQNSRRAGSAEVFIDTETTPGILTISDLGHGVADPQVLLDLHTSEWSDSIQSEDPAGAGFFSLATREWAEVQSCDWSIRLTPRVFQGKETAEVESAAAIAGLRISFPISSDELDILPRTLAALALYYPATVFLNNVSHPQKDFLGDAIKTEEWRGIRIGLIRAEWGIPYNRQDINFYGLNLSGDLASMRDPRLGYFYVAIDVQDAPDLKLVLPARKEVVKNAFWMELRQKSEILIYEYFASLDEHHLHYDHWLKANALGVPLKESAPCIVCDDRIIFQMPQDAIEKCFDSKGVEAVSKYLAEVNAVVVRDDYHNYSWAKALPKLESIKIEVVKDGQVIPWYELCKMESQWVDEIREIVTVDGAVVATNILPAFAIYEEIEDPDEWWGTSGGFDVKVFTSEKTPNIYDLVDLAEAACFEESEDGDTYDTQRENFRGAIVEHLSTAFLSGTESFRFQLEVLLRTNYFFIPEGMTATVTSVDRIAQVLVT